MSPKNQFTIIGNLGKDAELNTAKNDNSYSRFSVAVSKRYRDKDSGETKTVTNWFNLIIWGKRAEVLQPMLKKGTLVAVTGELVMTKKKPDDQYPSLDVKVDQIEILGGKRSSDEGSGSEENYGEFDGSSSDDDINM